MNQTPYDVPQIQVTANNPITLNSSFVLAWVPLYPLGFSIQIKWTGTPSGSFYLNASSDPKRNGTGVIPSQGFPLYTPPGLVIPVNSSQIANSSYSVSSAGENTWNVNGRRYNFVQLGYTDNSGGTSTAQLTFVNVLQVGPS